MEVITTALKMMLEATFIFISIFALIGRQL